MIYVITQPCEGVCDAACVQECPVDCIHGPISLEVLESVPKEDRKSQFPGIQLFIDPSECIFCGLCEDACPVAAIFSEDEVPVEWRHYIDKNAKFFKPV